MIKLKINISYLFIFGGRFPLLQEGDPDKTNIKIKHQKYLTYVFCLAFNPLPIEHPMGNTRLKLLILTTKNDPFLRHEVHVPFTKVVIVHDQGTTHGSPK